MLLKDILYKVKIVSVIGNTNTDVTGLQTDSRKVATGSCFIAVKGNATDGHMFIETAITKGASVIVCEIIPAIINENIVYVQVENSAVAAGIMSHNFYEEPSLKIKLTGVTGTNGKTTTTLLTHHLMKSAGKSVALAGNVGESLARKVAKENHDWYVIEISSFQLDGTTSFQPHIGILLNI